MSREYQVEIQKVPLGYAIPIKTPSFRPYQELYLDLLENKSKLKRNPPKPIFVAPVKSSHSSNSRSNDEGGSESNDEDSTLDEMEKAYRSGSEEEVFAHSSHHSESEESQEVSKSERSEKKDPSEPKKSTMQFENADDEEKKKADLLFDFMVLRRKYQNVEIPEFTEYSDYQTMKRTHENILRRVALDSSVETYKKYMMMGFLILEYVSTEIVGFDISGFAEFEKSTLNEYDILLLELGQKYYNPQGSRFPVEIRLTWLVLVNMVMFYLQKRFGIAKTSGTSVLNGLLNNFAGAVPVKEGVSPNGRKMKGPTIRPDEIG